MIRSYFRMAWRNLLRNKTSSLINIVGLSIAVGCSVVVFIFVDSEYSHDEFHENAERIFLVKHVVDREGKQETWGTTPIPLAQAMQNDLPQIERAVRVADRSGIMRYGDKVFNESIRFADPAFLDMFTFPLEQGEKPAPQEQNAVVLYGDVAAKYFGDENPIGRQISVTFNDTTLLTFTVKGVAEKFHRGASFGFGVLANFAKLEDLGVDFHDWKTWTFATFVEIDRPQSLPHIQAQTAKYLALQNEANEDWKISRFELDNLLNLALNSNEVRNDIARSGSSFIAVISMSFIALGLLLIACFNYMNIAVASASRRLKEIGIRKTIGGQRRQLIRQFLGENILLCAIALLIGAALAHSFFLPAFISLFGSVDYDAINKLFLMPSTWGYLIALLLATALISGAYPAFYISKFNPIHIFRGKEKFGGRTLLTRTLLSFQLIGSFVLITMAVVFTQNADFLRNRDWGYNQAQVIVTPVENESQFRALRTEMLQNPDVLQVAGSRHQIGAGRGVAVVNFEGKKYNINRFDVGHGFIETMDLRLKQGRTFDEKLQTDLTGAVLVNEQFVEFMNWEQALDKHIVIDGASYNIAGVIEDFHYRSFWEEIDPAIFRLASEDQFEHLLLKARAGAVIQTADALQTTWKRLFPDRPYTGGFQDEVFAQFYNEGESLVKLFSFVGVVALFLSCMGLFGLVSLNVAKRMKEFSIRKVLGASVANVAKLINREFLLLLVLVSLLAAPVSYFLVSALIDAVYAYHVPVTATPMIISVIAIFVTALMTVSSQVYRVAVADPVETLRNE